MELSQEVHSCGSMLPYLTALLKHFHMTCLRPLAPCWRCQPPALLPRSCKRPLALKLPKQRKRHHQAVAVGKTMQRQLSIAQGVPDVIQHQYLPNKHSSKPAYFAGKSKEHTGLDSSRPAPHLPQVWDHAANAHLGSSIIAPQSHRKA